MLNLNSSLTYKPNRVVSIVGPSRSGTTIFKHALCMHPDLCSLAGEEEPYYKLAQNGFPWHNSDEFHVAANPEVIRMLIANELHNYDSSNNRKILQSFGVEEPPFVDAVECTAKDTLVLKVPQNCYRRGVMEQLYPGAEIVYIKMTRDHRATINGMIDSWESGMFTARYDINEPGWWCLDMPPGWSWKTTVLERCTHQLRSALKFLSSDYQDTWSVAYEDFVGDWQTVCGSVWNNLGLSPLVLDPREVLPILSATHPPKVDRWKDKRPWLDQVKISL